MVQFSDHPWDTMAPLRQQFVRDNQAWCQAAVGCTHIMYGGSSKPLPPYWAKVEAVLRTLRGMQPGGFAMFLDTDARIVRDPRRVLVGHHGQGTNASLLPVR